MKKAWPVVSLGEVVRHRKHVIRIDDASIYKRCRVQLHAQGIVERDKVPGLEIKTKEQQICQSGELLVAEIDAKVGGFGMVPEELDGAIVSSHYFLFSIEESRLDRRFLGFYLRTATFREQVSAQGSTNYAAIRPQDVLGYKIPLPPLPEQRRILVRVEKAAAEIGAAIILRSEASGLGQALGRRARDVAFESFKGNERVNVASISAFVTKGTTPKTYGHSFAATGVPFLRAEEVGDGRLNWRATPFFLSPETNLFMNRSRTRAGDVLVTIAGTIGRAAVVPSDAPQLNMNQAVCVIRPLATADPEFLCHFIRSSAGQEQLRSATVTSAISNISLGTVRKVALPLPTLPEQRRIVAYLDRLHSKVDTLTTLQENTATELDALLPSILDRAFRGEL